jgi:tetratricopeptide (TPR) repeat protein
VRLAGLFPLVVLLGCGDVGPTAESAYIGRAACAACHADVEQAWTGSHHDLAMDDAGESTVLGDFDDAVFVSASGDTTRFYRRDGGFYVRAVGADGRPGDFEVAYTFGADPLQQYLIEFPDGRVQSLDVAWDARPPDAGGQRWFHLYPEDPPSPGDALHWAGLDQTWNYQCAECHSTNLDRGYDAATDTYATTWSEIDVSCEACHGPGSEHAGWAQTASSDAPPLEIPGFAGLGAPGAWVFEPGAAIAARTTPLESRAQVETCARCHSRRGVIAADYTHGAPILDTHRVSLLNEGLYHADGQIEDEVYVYGSFLQSRMYRAGVTCTDCHDPHTGRPRAEGNVLCGQCHLPTTYDTPDHTLHVAGSDGSRCVDCHMPETTYMGVDPRRDHAFSAPRPDVSAAIGAPDACTRCHTDQSQDWAAGALADGIGPTTSGGRVGPTLHAARRGDPRVSADLGALVGDTAEAAIVRGTAATLLGRVPGPRADRALRAALTDPEPLVRLGALGALAGPGIQSHWRAAYHLLTDEVAAVRLEAALRLAFVPADAATPEENQVIDSAIDEYVSSQLVNAERPEAHLNIAAVRLARGNPGEARLALDKALALDPTFVAAYANLADLHRAVGNDAGAAAVLERGLQVAPDDPALLHSLGLSRVRSGEMTDALDLLRRAYEAEPENPRYGYVYAVALSSSDSTDAALQVLRDVLEVSPFNRDALLGLATIARDQGLRDEALLTARRLRELWPNDPAAAQLLAELDPSAR